MHRDILRKNRCHEQKHKRPWTLNEKMTKMEKLAQKRVSMLTTLNESLRCTNTQLECRSKQLEQEFSDALQRNQCLVTELSYYNDFWSRYAPWIKITRDIIGHNNDNATMMKKVHYMLNSAKSKFGVKLQYYFTLFATVPSYNSMRKRFRRLPSPSWAFQVAAKPDLKSHQALLCAPTISQG
jgi:hypothetical protein